MFAHVGVLSVNQYLYDVTGFDPIHDFAPVGLVGTNPMVLLVSAKSGIETLPQLVERSRKGDLKIATSGNGSTLHLAAEQFFEATGGRADLIPYRGGAPAVNDLLAGIVDMLVEQAFSAIPNSRSGQAKALLVTGPKRLPALADGPDHLDLVLAKGYLGRLVRNERISRYLEQHHKDIYSELIQIVE